MKNLDTVEDYIEVLAQVRGMSYIFKLARYDAGPIKSIAYSTFYDKLALTDRQAELCIKLISTYKRQFAKNNIDISSIENNPVYRKPLRKVDRQCRVFIDDGKIILKFPFNEKMIKQIRDYRTSAIGTVQFNKDLRQWELSLNEFSLTWAVTWAEINKINIDQDVRELHNRVVDCETKPYAIELRDDNGKLIITNAENSLVEYIQQTIGNIDYDNICRIVDYATILGYTVSDEVINKVPAEVVIFANSRTNLLPPCKEHLEIVFKYARLTKRWPVIIYDPLITNSPFTNTPVKMLTEFGFDESEIATTALNGTLVAGNISSAKVIYAKKIPSELTTRIPLLITTVAMISSRNHLKSLQNAEKVVSYYKKNLISEV